MIDSSVLLRDLQAELGLLVTDLESVVAVEGPVRAGLEGEWRAAFDAGRTGRTFEAWVEDRLTQVAVGWVLGVVFVRFGEDNGLIAEARLSGPGDRGAAALVAQNGYFAAHPHESDREYVQSVFRAAAALPGLDGVLGEGESPLWLVDPPADAVTRLLTVVRRTDESGGLVHDFTDPTWGTRFLGDLYQDLSEHAKSAYALLQTPEFVEEFILDRTLEPALEAFGLAATTLIDPTCGSGHFLLGAFERLFDARRQAEPGTSERELAQRALSAVTGVDLNPFAAAIARFRLLVAALKACGIARLADAPRFDIDVAVGDSLLWGRGTGQLDGMEVASTTTDRQFLYVTEHAEALRRVFSRSYAAVVGNPPYIVCRDAALNQQYRDRYSSCHRQYSLGVPFTEKFFDLAAAPDGLGRPAGFVGMITANSFMKREFGRKLIEQHIPTWDLTHIIDTSGAYIPGHGTPTVILLGRHQRPVADTVRIVMGMRGEPSVPDDPADGMVWSALKQQVDEPGSSSAFVNVGDVDRSRLGRHPWSLGGGGASELKYRLEDASSAVLGAHVEGVGSAIYTRCDDAYVAPSGTARRLRLDDGEVREFVEGGDVRDWGLTPGSEILFPYTDELLAGASDGAKQRLWPYYSVLVARKELGGSQLEIGLEWFEYNRFLKHRFMAGYLVTFSNVSTHNHFVRVASGVCMNAHAPVLHLSDELELDQVTSVLGLLNSAVVCFWMKQVSFDKGLAGAGNMGKTEEWRRDFEFDGTKLKALPLPHGLGPVHLAQRLSEAAVNLAAQAPTRLAASVVPSRRRLDAVKVNAERIFAEMVSLQEELDWACLHLYGLTDDALMVPEGDEPPPLQLGERAFEIVLARQLAAGKVETGWFTRHGSIPITEIPSHWPEWYRVLVARRIALITSDRDVGLVERPEHKRRWVTEPWEKREQAALRGWLQDRLEERALWFEGSGDGERAVCRSVAQLADRVGVVVPEFWEVARLWKGTVEIDPVKVLGELVADEHVPVQSAARYKGKGFDKRRQWERTWDLQRIEDRGEPLPGGLERIPVPPKYGPGDFAKTSYWRHRGKLDVPKERFTSVHGAGRDADPTMVLAWAGFDHAELAQALATLIVDRKSSDGWDADRLWPLVVGLVEQLPWLDQWHHAIDARWGSSPADLYRGIAEQEALAGGRSLADAATYTLPPPTRGRKKVTR